MSRIISWYGDAAQDHSKLPSVDSNSLETLLPALKLDVNTVWR